MSLSIEIQDAKSTVKSIGLDPDFAIGAHSYFRRVRWRCRCVTFLCHIVVGGVEVNFVICANFDLLASLHGGSRGTVLVRSNASFIVPKREKRED